MGYNCGSRAPIQPGEQSLVLGDGMVGQWTAQTLASRGAKVLMVGRHASRLSLAAHLSGAETIFDQGGRWIEAMRSSSPDSLAIAVDTVGSAQVTDALIDLMQRGGHIVSAGFIPGDDRVSLQRLRDREISLDSVAGLRPERMASTLDMIRQGKLQTLPLITHRFRAKDAAVAWRTLQVRREDVLGVVLEWD